MRTIQTGIELGYLAATSFADAPVSRALRRRRERITEVTVHRGPVRMDKLVAVCTSRDPGSVPDQCREAMPADLDAVVAASVAAWDELWEACDCEVVGNPTYTRALRFGVYHLLIAATPDDPTVNIGAKSLSGEGYRGHVFWDTEIFMLPFFILTQPDTAKALLSYRHHTLDGARANSREYGTGGARFAWESADTGREECPKFTPDGANRFWTREEEVHVSADVAYGIFRYVEATGDRAFLHDIGAEVLFGPRSKDGVIEQFTGYFERDDVPIAEWDENDMPRYPQGYHHFNCEPTKLLKQPDVVMLMYLLPDEFDAATKRANFDYYEARTLHKSSLSPSIHAIIGIEVGDTTRAVQYFERSALVDLTDNQGNTAEGMHIASAGGTWQILVNGFGGLRILGGQVTLTPWLPTDWEGFRFRIRWRGRPIRVAVDHTHVELLLGGPSGGQEEVLVDGKPVTLTAGELVRVGRR
jgi:trehalose/maltose hydrolase-like predicted phosphorylase